MNDRAMSVTHLHDWRFADDGDIEAGIAAIRDYVDDLVQGDTGLELSLWLRDEDDPSRFFHLAVYDTREALETSSGSRATQRFVERLYPEIDTASHSITTCETALSSRADIG